MRLSIIINIIVGILIFWLIVTVWAQCAGDTRVVIIGDEEAPKRALIVYNPDPQKHFIPRFFFFENWNFLKKLNQLSSKGSFVKSYVKGI